MARWDPLCFPFLLLVRTNRSNFGREVLLPGLVWKWWFENCSWPILVAGARGAADGSRDAKVGGEAGEESEVESMCIVGHFAWWQHFSKDSNGEARLACLPTHRTSLDGPNPEHRIWLLEVLLTPVRHFSSFPGKGRGPNSSLCSSGINSTYPNGSCIFDPEVLE